jgi:hypothetical protein
MKAPNLSSIELREHPDGLEECFLVDCDEDASLTKLVTKIKRVLKKEGVTPHRITFDWLDGKAELIAYYVED